MGQGKGRAGRERRQQNAAARLAQTAAQTTETPAYSASLLVDPDSARWLSLRSTNQLLRRVRIDPDDPTHLSTIGTDERADAHRRWSEGERILHLRGGQWISVHDLRDTDHIFAGQPSNAIVCVLETEVCRYDPDTGRCRTHRAMSAPYADATYALSGTELDAHRQPRGGGVLVWCYDKEHARDEHERLSRCCFLRDLSYHPCDS